MIDDRTITRGCFQTLGTNFGQFIQHFSWFVQSGVFTHLFLVPVHHLWTSRLTGYLPRNTKKIGGSEKVLTWGVLHSGTGIIPEASAYFLDLTWMTSRSTNLYPLVRIVGCAFRDMSRRSNFSWIFYWAMTHHDPQEHWSPVKVEEGLRSGEVLIGRRPHHVISLCTNVCLCDDIYAYFIS